MNAVKAVIILGILLTPYLLMHGNAQQEVKVDIASGSKNVGNGKFYVPARITIPVGTTVVWTNLDDDKHTVTDGTPASKQWGIVFDSGIMCPAKSNKDNPCQPNSVFKFTFYKVGEYAYLCALHPWMSGKVTVVPEGAAVPVEISITTDKTSYNLGDNVVVGGNVSPVAADQPVVIEVLNPNNAELKTDKITVKEDGAFNYNFKLQGDLVLPGSYTVKVSYSDTSKESTFTVGNPEKPSVKSSANVKVLAKQLKDLLLIRVSNVHDSNADVYGMSFQILDVDIKAFKGPKDWSKPETLSSEVKSSTQGEPIKAGEKITFQLKVKAEQITVIHWIAYASSESILAQGDAKPISRQ